MTSHRAEVMAEIERLEGELRRISHELEQLRRKVEPARSGRTMAFASPVSQPPQSSKQAPTSDVPPTQRAPSSPSPGSRVKTTTRTIPPAAASASGGNNTGRRVASPATGLEMTEEQPPAQPSRKQDSGRDLGRYGFVEKSSRTSNTRR